MKLVEIEVRKWDADKTFKVWVPPHRVCIIRDLLQLLGPRGQWLLAEEPELVAGRIGEEVLFVGMKTRQGSKPIHVWAPVDRICLLEDSFTVIGTDSFWAHEEDRQQTIDRINALLVLKETGKRNEG